MEKNIKWFSVAFGMAFGASVGSLVTAAMPDNNVYESGGNRIEVTSQDAGCFAQCAINAKIWDGDPTGIIKTCAYKDTNVDSGFSAYAIGLKIGDIKEVPKNENPIIIHGVVE